MNRIRAEAQRLPQPARGMLESLSGAGTAQVAGTARTAMGANIESQVGSLCRSALSGRYPFTRSATKDVLMDDFSALFAPGGSFDTFFEKNLASAVDVSTRPWSFRRGVDAIPSGTSASLLAFQRAAVIRSVFFRGGARQPSLRVELKPLEMDPSLKEMNLNIDGQRITYTQGAPVPKTVTWPGPDATHQVRLQASPDPGVALQTSGPWALHRFFDLARIQPGPNPESFEAVFNLNGKRIAIGVTAGSVQNPFRLRELEEFRCPGGL
jgi:type VI secretion system protein ImpL